MAFDMLGIDLLLSPHQKSGFFELTDFPSETSNWAGGNLVV